MRDCLRCVGSEYKLECIGIFGRKFESITDRVRYLYNGGSAEIVSLLAENTLGG